MIEKIKILELVQGALEGTDKYLVNLKVTPDNRIYVDIDGDNGVNIDDCIELSRATMRLRPVSPDTTFPTMRATGRGRRFRCGVSVRFMHGNGSSRSG